MHIGIHTGWGDETEREKGNMGGSDGGGGRGEREGRTDRFQLCQGKSNNVLLLRVWSLE